MSSYQQKKTKLQSILVTRAKLRLSPILPWTDSELKHTRNCNSRSLANETTLGTLVRGICDWLFAVTRVSLQLRNEVSLSELLFSNHSPATSCHLEGVLIHWVLDSYNQRFISHKIIFKLSCVPYEFNFGLSIVRIGSFASIRFFE